MSLTKLGTVIDDLEHVLAPPKCFGVSQTVLPLKGTENLGIIRPLNLTPPNSVNP